MCSVARQLKLLSCVTEDVLPFCIEVIIKTLKVLFGFVKQMQLTVLMYWSTLSSFLSPSRTLSSLLPSLSLPLSPPLSLSQDVAFSDPKNERALGQLVVLLQYNWPKEEEQFASVITTIQKRRRFNFPQFFKYVVSILRSTLCPDSIINSTLR